MTQWNVHRPPRVVPIRCTNRAWFQRSGGGREYLSRTPTVGASRAVAVVGVANKQLTVESRARDQLDASDAPPRSRSPPMGSRRPRPFAFRHLPSRLFRAAEGIQHRLSRSRSSTTGIPQRDVPGAHKFKGSRLSLVRVHSVPGRRSSTPRRIASSSPRRHEHPRAEPEQPDRAPLQAVRVAALLSAARIVAR